MNFFRLLMLGFSLLPMVGHAANAPSQQKVVLETSVKADVSKVWNVIKDFSALQKWHPLVTGVTTEMKKDETGADVLHRTISLKDGSKVIEKLIQASDEDMKLEYRMIDGALPVSGYRAVIVVKPGQTAGEVVVNWTGRFYNKANKVDAPPGEDNATAVKAIEDFYAAGLPNLKQLLEKNGI